MEKIININGVDYIRKSEYDKAKKDADIIRQAISSSLADLSNCLDNQSNTQKNMKVFSERSKQLQLRQIATHPYQLGRMEKDGTLYSIQNRKMVFTIKDVIKIDKRYDASTTKKDIKSMSKDFNISEDTIHRIIYNLDKNIFKEYTKKFLVDINMEIVRKPAPVQNNPEKRRESVLFSS